MKKIKIKIDDRLYGALTALAAGRSLEDVIVGVLKYQISISFLISATDQMEIDSILEKYIKRIMDRAKNENRN